MHLEQTQSFIRSSSLEFYRPNFVERGSRFVWLILLGQLVPRTAPNTAPNYFCVKSCVFRPKFSLQLD